MSKPQKMITAFNLSNKNVRKVADHKLHDHVRKDTMNEESMG
jgi:hypothetical protein